VVVQIRLFTEPSFFLKATLQWTDAADLVADTGPYRLIGNDDFSEIVWFPQEGRDSASVLVLHGNEVPAPRIEEPGAENRILRLHVPVDLDTFANLAIQGMEDSVCRGENLADWERLNSNILKYIYPPFENRDCLAVDTAAKVLLDISPVIREALEGIPVLPTVVSGLMSVIRPVLEVLAWSAGPCNSEITAQVLPDPLESHTPAFQQALAARLGDLHPEVARGGCVARCQTVLRRP
jgi:hypothetical protein